MVCSNLSVADGVASFAMNYFKCIDRSKIHIDFAIFHDTPSIHREEIKKTNSKVFVLPELKYIIKHFKECKRIIREGNYDIIHNNTINVSLPLMIIAQKYKIPIRIIHSHNSRFGEGLLKECRNRLLFFLLKQTATSFAACSELAGLKTFGKKEFKVIPNVIQDSTFHFDSSVRAQIREKMGVKDKIIIGSVGRVAKQKNPLFALDVIASLIERNDKIEYWWIGSGVLDSLFLQKAQDLNIQDKVKLLGTRSDVRELYQAMDCFFMPSLFEGLPISCVEAQAMGLPCVISDRISQEVAYTDLVEFCSLREDICKWTFVINEQITRKIQREKYTKVLEKSCYSITNAAKKMESFYAKELI